ncbi:MAG: fatty acid desaturase [Myxococcota bacterium]|nr:fatty acid desaturase [Myxococcota bacterium]
MLKKDGPGLARAAVTVVSFALSGWAAVHFYNQQSLAAWVALILCAVALVGFFPLMHETGHRTAFSSDFANSAGTWLGALPMLQSPSFFREMHLAHHRWTQDPERDPEISLAPDFFTDWAGNPLSYLVRVSGQPLMLGKLAFTLACAFFPYSLWHPLFPFVGQDKRRRVAWESRLSALLIVGGGGLGLLLVPGFAFFLLAWPLAHLGLGIYLMAEHSGMAHQGSQFERTRTFLVHPGLSWLMWNMPYHAEHHAYPAIPFHTLPSLHQQSDPAELISAESLMAFHREAIRRCLGA